MKKQPWDREILEEQASPILAASFSASAELLSGTLSGESLDYLQRVYLDPPKEMDPPAEPLAGLLVGAGLLLSPQPARDLLAYAAEEHRDPFLAIAAQALDFGDGEDQSRAGEILKDLATRAQFAEAAVILWVLGEHMHLPTEARTQWRQQAATLWPPSVRGADGQVTRMTPFGSYYTAHVLAARAAMEAR